MNWRQAQQASMQAAASAPKKSGGDPLLGTLGSVAGTAVGGAMGGPLGAQLGGSLGGQLAGSGTIDPTQTAMGMATSGAGKDMLTAGANKYIRDPLKAGFQFAEGGSVWDSVRKATGFTERNKKLTGGKKKVKSAAEMREAAYKAHGGMITNGFGDDGFMSAHPIKNIGPLAGVKFKQTDGKNSQEYEKKYHNPLAISKGPGGKAE